MAELEILASMNIDDHTETDELSIRRYLFGVRNVHFLNHEDIPLSELMVMVVISIQRQLINKKWTGQPA